MNLSPDMFTPQRFPKSGLRPDVFNYTGIARLKPGVTPRWRTRMWRVSEGLGKGMGQGRCSDAQGQPDLHRSSRM